MTSTPPPLRSGRAALLACLLLLGHAALAETTQTFSRGALIIPQQASFQTGCGSVSAYGLIWRILQANGPGGVNAASPVTVYWVINGNKQSPNRCVPTNRHLPPAPNNGAWNDPAWNDGCDLTITNTAEMPVVPVDLSVPFPASGVYPRASLPNTGTSTYTARPTYPAVTLDNTVASPRFQTVQYMGGPFVIAAQDAPKVINLLRSSTDPSIVAFRTPCWCGTFSNGLGCHYVQLHQATTEFTAPVGKRINEVPPRIALLDSGGGVSTGILNDYLSNAGLLFDGAAGCPPGRSCVIRGQPVTAQGLIYDQLHAIDDLVTTPADPYGLLNHVDARGRPLYRIFWAPHWESLLSQVTAGGVATTATTPQVANALDNIARFTDSPGHGLLAECASLESFEGSYEKIGVNPYAVSLPNVTDSTRFLFTNGVTINGLSHNMTNWDGRNCTDPDYLALPSPRPSCVVYSNPEEPFSQLGDFHYTATIGHVDEYWPHQPNGSALRPGAKRLAVSWENYSPGAFSSATYSGNNGWDFFTLGQKDNDPNKATLVYLAGHTYTGTVAGNRIVLNTIMNLGANPLSSDRAVTAPTAFEDTNGTDAAGTRALLLSSTYQVVSGTLAPGTVTLDFDTGSRWRFPFTRGNLRAHTLVGAGALAQGESDLAAAALWDADAAMPLPAQRNLFTYFGGEARTNPVLPGGRAARNGVLQVGWTPERIHSDRIIAGPGAVPATGCVDVLRYGAQGGSLGLVPGADGLCDLQQALQLTPVTPDAAFNADAASQTRLQADVPRAQQLVQTVRGHCFATDTRADGSGAPVLSPVDTQCNSPDADNRAHLGGLVHSTAAVVMPSPNVPDAGGRRPTVAYVAGFDGQLHALYVSGGAGYTGPAAALGFPNPDASSAFSTNLAGRFSGGTPPPPGTELWAYLPSSQLPFLKSNMARVDSSPVVQDVFVDLTGSGVREWHTVLAVSVGETGREVFAFDVTNPLKPVLLWDVVGSNAQVSNYPPFASAVVAGGAAGGTQAFKWHEPTALFLTPDQADSGREPSALYDYSDLGGSRGLALGQLRAGLQPVYAVFLASNSSKAASAPAKGLEVFAIEVATGQKLWQWEQPYTDATRASDNTVPAGLTLRSGAAGVSRVYAGDMEGRVWELDAGTGANANVERTAPGCTPCRFAAFDTQGTVTAPRPITTNVALARSPTAFAPGSPLAPYPSQPLLVFGTAGADWVPATVAGSIHLALLDARYRKPVRAGGAQLDGTALSQPAALASAEASGLLPQPPPFPLTAFTAPERMYGNVTVAGQTVFIPTARGVVNDLFSLNPDIGGTTYALDLGGPVSAASLANFNLANFGGVTVFHEGGPSPKDHILGAEVSRLTQLTLDNAGSTAAKPDATLAPEGGGPTFRLLNWMRRFSSQ